MGSYSDPIKIVTGTEQKPRECWRIIPFKALQAFRFKGASRNSLQGRFKDMPPQSWVIDSLKGTAKYASEIQRSARTWGACCCNRSCSAVVGMARASALLLGRYAARSAADPTAASVIHETVPCVLASGARLPVQISAAMHLWGMMCELKNVAKSEIHIHPPL